MDKFKKAYSRGCKGCGNPFCKYCGNFTKRDKKILRRLGRHRLKEAARAEVKEEEQNG